MRDERIPGPAPLVRQVARLSLFNTLFYTIVASVIKFALGLWLALLLNRNLPFKSFFSAIVLLPFIVPTALSAIAFWWMVAAAVIAACRLARRSDPLIALIGIVVLVAIAAYLIEGWYDQGLVSLRVSIVIGAALGTVEAAHRLTAVPRAR